MRLGLVILCLVSMAGSALAQSVQVRSGEHDTYSRLTMPLPGRLDWEVVETETGIDLVFDSPSLSLDTSKIFSRIPQDRITGAEWVPNARTLRLTLACNCPPTAFWHSNSLLVLDIADGPPKPETLITQAPPEPVLTDLLAFETVPRARTLGLDTMPVGVLEEDTAEEPPFETASLSPALREELLKQVSRAASQGLLQPRTPSVVPAATQPAPKPQAESADMADKEPDQPTDHINLRAHSSIDQDFLDAFAGNQQSLAGTGCLPNAQIDVASWGNDTSFGQQISNLHLHLTGEFDEVDPDVAKRLVRLYLFFGFGAEAASILTLLPEEDADRPLLAQLAQVAEMGHAGPSPRYLLQLDCESPAALWAALSYERLPSNKVIDTDAILRAINALPKHLRSYYGPILSRRFLAHGDADTSASILRILERNSVTQTPQSELASADLKNANGEEAAADAALEDLAESNAEPSVTALVQMIDRRFADNREISYELAQLAGSYAYERKAEPMGPELSAAYIRALAASGAVDQSFAEFTRAHPDLPKAHRAELWSDILARAADIADEMTFLRYAIPAADTSATVSIAAGNAMADRLLSLGFPDEALAFLSKAAPPNHPEAEARMILRARQALAMNTPRRAIVELLGLEGAEVYLLRAQARVMVGEHKTAYHLLTAADKPEEANKQAWLAGEWRTAGGGGNPVYDALAETLEETAQADTADSGASETVLASNRTLVEQSASMREAMDALLADNPLPAEADE